MMTVLKNQNSVIQMWKNQNIYKTLSKPNPIRFQNSKILARLNLKDTDDLDLSTLSQVFWPWILWRSQNSLGENSSLVWTLQNIELSNNLIQMLDILAGYNLLPEKTKIYHIDNQGIEKAWSQLHLLEKNNSIISQKKIELISLVNGETVLENDKVQITRKGLQVILEHQIKPESIQILIDSTRHQIRYQLLEARQNLFEVEQKLNVNAKLWSSIDTKFQSIFGSQGILQAEVVEKGKSEREELIENQMILTDNLKTLELLLSRLSNSYPILVLVRYNQAWMPFDNLALAVNSNEEYSLFYNEKIKTLYLIAEKSAVKVLRLLIEKSQVYNDPDLDKELAQITESGEYFEKLKIGIHKLVSFKGEDLIGIEYIQLKIIKNQAELLDQGQIKTLNRIYSLDSVNADIGTGIQPIGLTYSIDSLSLINKFCLPISTNYNSQGFLKNDNLVQKIYCYDDNKLLTELQKSKTIYSTLESNQTNWITQDGEATFFYPQDILKVESESLNKIIDYLIVNTSIFPKENEQLIEKYLHQAQNIELLSLNKYGPMIPIWQSKTGEKIFISSIDELIKKSKNQIYKVFTSKNLNPENFINRSVTVINDKITKLPMGVNVVEYRSEALTEMRKSRNNNEVVFFGLANKLMNELYGLFAKGHTDIQILFEPYEVDLWSNWLYGLGGRVDQDNSVNKGISYFYVTYQKNEITGQYIPSGEYELLNLANGHESNLILEDAMGAEYYHTEKYLNKDLINSSNLTFWTQQAEYVKVQQVINKQELSSSLANQVIFSPLSSNLLNCKYHIYSSWEGSLKVRLINYLENFNLDTINTYLIQSLSGNFPARNYSQTEITALNSRLNNSFNEIINWLTQLMNAKKPTNLRIRPKYKLITNQWWQAYTFEYWIKINTAYSTNNFLEALNLTYNYWRDFRQVYLSENNNFNEIDQEFLYCLVESLENFAQSAHPIWPVFTEQIWSLVNNTQLSIIETPLPEELQLSDKHKILLNEMKQIKKILADIQSLRNQNKIAIRQALYADISNLNLDDDWINYLCTRANLVVRDLNKIMGSISEFDTKYGSLKIDWVIDEELAIIGYGAEFEKAVTDYLRNLGIKPGETVIMEWQIDSNANSETIHKLVNCLNWHKLFIEVRWTKDLAVDSKYSFKVADLGTIYTNKPTKATSD